MADPGLQAADPQLVPGGLLANVAAQRSPADIPAPQVPAPPSATASAQQTDGSVTAGFDRFIRETRGHEGLGKDAHSSAVSGFMPDTWLNLMRHRRDMTGKSDAEILALRDDRSPEGEQLRQWATGAYAV